MPMSIRRILACIQFDESREPTLRYACCLAKHFHAELHILHVIEKVPEPDIAALSPGGSAYARGGEETMLALPPEWQGKLTCHPSVRFGVPWMEITQYAVENDIDVIVLGNTYYSVLRRWFLGSVPDQVVHHAPCPIFVIPYPEPQVPEP